MGNQMKKPEECSDIHEIRCEIDRLDHEIIVAMGRRRPYVKAASKLKADEAGVKAPDRVSSMLLQRRAWAVEEGLDPDLIEKIYRDLVTYFINEELTYFRSLQK